MGEFARATGYHISTIWRWSRAGKLTATSVSYRNGLNGDASHRWLIDVDATLRNLSAKQRARIIAAAARNAAARAAFVPPPLPERTDPEGRPTTRAGRAALYAARGKQPRSTGDDGVPPPAVTAEDIKRRYFGGK